MIQSRDKTDKLKKSSDTHWKCCVFTQTIFLKPLQLVSSDTKLLESHSSCKPLNSRKLLDGIPRVYFVPFHNNFLTSPPPPGKCDFAGNDPFANAIVTPWQKSQLNHLVLKLFKKTSSDAIIWSMRLLFSTRSFINGTVIAKHF